MQVTTVPASSGELARIQEAVLAACERLKGRGLELSPAQSFWLNAETMSAYGGERG